MTDTKSRSPKAPSIPLQQAISEIQPVFEEETRNRMSREVLASHLGYSGLSGASASKIGALRHFGLIEGREDELRVSELSIVLLMQGASTPEYKAAAKHACLNPSLYKEIFENFDGRPSQKNLEYWLIQRGAQKKAAPKMSTTFLESADFAELWEEQTEVYEEELGAARDPDVARVTQVNVPATESTSSQMPVNQGEREVASGLLSKETSFRLIVKGPLSTKEIENLIRKLEVDKEILSD